MEKHNSHKNNNDPANPIQDSIQSSENGKLGKNTIPAISDNSTTISNDSSTQINDFENSILQIWSDVLNISLDIIDKDQNYFKMGGSSLFSMLISINIRNQLKKDCTPRHLYENPTISSLAKVLIKQENIQTSEKTNQIINIDNKTVFFSGADSQFMIWMNLFSMKNPVGNINAVFKLHGAFDLALFEKSVNNVLKFHDSIWSSFYANKPALTVGEPGQVNINLIDISNNTIEEQDKRFNEIVLNELHTPFNIFVPPLIRISLVKRKATEHTLLVSSPHIISFDGSIISLCKEIFQSYDNNIANDNSGNGKKDKYGIGDIIRSERDYLTSPAYNTALEYFTNKLSGMKPLFLNKEYFLEKGKPDSKKLIEEIIFSDQVMDGFHRISIQNNITIPQIILSALALAIHEIAEQDDIPVWMAVDISSSCPKPPVIDNHAAPILIRSALHQGLNYVQYLNAIKMYIVDAFNYIGFPGPILNTFLAPPPPKKKFFVQLLVNFLNVILYRFMGKGRVEKKVIDAMTNYLGNELVVKQNMKKNDMKKIFAPSFMYNVLPGFFGEKILLKNHDLTIDCVNDFLLIKDNRAFMENSNYMDARLAFFNLTRNKDNQIVLYMSGGGLNQKAFLILKNYFNVHTSRMIDNLHDNILSSQICK
jgi:hypothetical protein